MASNLEQELAKDATSESWDDNVFRDITPVRQVINEANDNPATKKMKSSYVDEIKVSDIVAFSVNSKAISGMVEEIHADSFLIATKNGVKFTVKKQNILWVKTNARWPRGVWLALKGDAGIDEYRRPDKESV